MLWDGYHLPALPVYHYRPFYLEEPIKWNLPIELTPEEQKIAQRAQKARKFFVFLRERRHELQDATFQETLAKTYRPEPDGPRCANARRWSMRSPIN